MLRALLDEFETLPPLLVWLHIPTPDAPYVLYRRWDAHGTPHLTDAAGRAWWAFTATVPRECAWCHAPITVGYEAWRVGSACGWHIHLQHEREASDGPDDRDPTVDLVSDRGGQPDRAAAGAGGGVSPQRGSGLSGVRCPDCGERVVMLPDGHWYCPACAYWIDPVDGGHTPIICEPEPDLNTSGEGPC